MGEQGRSLREGKEDMIGRVANSLVDGVLATMHPDDAEYWRSKAYEAIFALREPTAGMLAAALPNTSEPCDTDKRLAARAFTLVSPHSDSRIQDGIAVGAELVRDWRSMIDAALKGGPSGESFPSSQEEMLERLSHCEASLAIYDEGGCSEYWLRYHPPISQEAKRG